MVNLKESVKIHPVVFSTEADCFSKGRLHMTATSAM